MGDDDLLPKKKTTTSSTAKTSSKPSSGKPRRASLPMRRIMRFTRAIGILLGGFVTLLGLMSIVGAVTDNFWIRLAVALLAVVGLPAFVSDRFLKRTNGVGGISLIGDIFAIVLLGIALVFVGVDFASKPMFVREGDRYARSGSRLMARAAYFLGGVSPTFPDDKGAAPPPGSASASASSSAARGPDASTGGGH